MHQSVFCEAARLTHSRPAGRAELRSPLVLPGVHFILVDAAPQGCALSKHLQSVADKDPVADNFGLRALIAASLKEILNALEQRPNPLQKVPIIERRDRPGAFCGKQFIVYLAPVVPELIGGHDLTDALQLLQSDTRWHSRYWLR